MKSALSRLHNILAWLILAGCILQIYLIARYVFGEGTRDTHAFSGFIIEIIALVSLIIALIIRVNKWNVILSLVIFLLLFPVQPFLAYSEINGSIRALHGVNGLLILSLSYVLANGFAKAVVPRKVVSETNRASQAAAASD